MEFWKSKTFWTLVIMFILNMLNQFGVIELGQIEVYANIILTVLALIFRWQAQGPLTVTSK